MSTGLPSPWDLDRSGWEDVLVDEPSYRVDQVWRGLYENGTLPHLHTALPARLRRRLADELRPGLELVTRHETDEGDTVKYLWRLDDGATIETVLMHYVDRSTVCISSQAGCAMGCGFCATGQAGYERHLSVGEMLEQVATASVEAAPRRLSNVVLMGMGEPFANYDRVLAAVHRIIGDMGIGARKITISTVGLVPQILRFADEGLQVGLAVSLHAANDELRSELVPINRRYPIDELVQACVTVRRRTGRRVSFEWAMIDGVNDRPSDVDQLADVASRASAHVNLIPLNPTPGWPTTGSPASRIADFAHQLRRRGVNATIRANRGTDIDAACGQLRANHAVTPVTLGVPTS